MSREIKSRKHILCEKAPVIAILLGCIIAVIVVTLPGLFIPAGITENIVSSIVALIFIIVFNRWFAPELKSLFRSSVHGRELCIICAPFVFKFVASYLLGLADTGFYFEPTMLSFSMGLAAGFYEETLFRAVTVPLGMRYLKSKNRMYIIVFATALVFGLLHIGNVNSGASVSVSVIQGIATIFAGFVFIAVYLRTGNVLIPIFMHSIFDYMCFVTDPTLENGIMTGATVSTGLILALAVEIIAGLWGLWLIRPAMKEKIEALWDEKWSVTRR